MAAPRTEADVKHDGITTSQPDLAPEERQRLLEVAGDMSLPTWQRDLMRRLARGEPADGAALEVAGPSASQRLDSPDGTWVGLTPEGRYRFSVIYDAARSRMVLFGGSDTGNYNDVWALLLVGTPHWLQLTPTGTPPSARSGHTAIYDPIRDRMIVFGGPDNALWSLSLAGDGAWTQLSPTGTPPAIRTYTSAIYDPVGDRMILFGGGAGATYRNDVWQLALAGSTAWTLLSPTGTPPSGRYGHSAIYDPSRTRMVVFGGYSPTYLRDVWTLSLSGSLTWAQISPGGTLPIARAYHTANYDAANDRMLVVGGYDGGTYRNDVWELVFAGSATWTLLAPGGSAPGGRAYFGTVRDPLANRLVVFGGRTTTYLNDTWALSLVGGTSWAPLIPIAPNIRESATAIYDRPRRRIILFGGWDGTAYRNDIWALSLDRYPSWTALSPAGTPPSGRTSHSSIYDPLRDRMLVFGGYDGGNRNDLWALDLTGGTAWTALSPTGTPPSVRFGHAAIYDALRDRMVIFGGLSGTLKNDVWALSLAGTPAWTQLAPTGTPPAARHSTSAIYDSLRDRMVIFSGSTGFTYNDVWMLSLAGGTAWSAITPAGVPPSNRYGHTAIYDRARDRMVVFGGTGGSNDAWEMALAVPNWTQLTATRTPWTGWGGQVAIYDPDYDRMIVFGSSISTVNRNNAWYLAWADPAVSVPPVLGGERLALAPAYPNPAHGKVSIGFALPRPGIASLRLYDVSGRAVRTLLEGPRQAGAQSVRWDSRLDSGERARPGVYFYVLRVGEQSVSRKFSILE